jgi:hypothetical protein
MILWVLRVKDFGMSLMFPMIGNQRVVVDEVGLKEVEMVSLRIIFGDLMEFISGFEDVHVNCAKINKTIYLIKLS